MSGIGPRRVQEVPDLSETSSTNSAAEGQGWATARTLAEALPFIQQYDRETVVIKYGGHAMIAPELKESCSACIRWWCMAVALRSRACWTRPG